MDQNRRIDEPELWLVHLARSARALEAFEADNRCLSNDDIERLTPINDPAERNNRRLCHIALRCVLERWLGPMVRTLALARTPEGKPSVPGAALEFSLSHTGPFAAIVIARAGPLGIDIEQEQNAVMPSPRRGEIVAAAAGLTGLSIGDPTRDADFVRAWTQVEAFGKARGQGLPAVLRDLGILGRGQRASADIIATSAHCARIANLQLATIPLPPRLIGTLAASKELAIPSVRLFPSEHDALKQMFGPG
ncbi:MAG TPA: hypothetical protein VHG27_08275 [Xanthobacteraceae bacterium]|nr:hypothetical protein [Xanthobacteraceae bacterium]